MKLWFEFSKTSKMKYISYLDLLRVLARGVVRSGFKLNMSQGYNPQPKISFAHPLPLGVAASKDYGEMELAEENISLIQIVDKINENLPSGFSLLSVKAPAVDKPPKLMSLVDASAYQFQCANLINSGELEKIVEQVWNSEDLVITTWHKKKKKYVEKNLRPMIYQLQQSGTSISCIVQSGSRGNLRPDDLATALFQDNQALHKLFCERREVYCLKGERKIEDNLVPLWHWDEIDNV